MALILKQGKMFQDKQGYLHNEFYAVIDNVHVDKKDMVCDFAVEIYKSKEDRNKTSCERVNFNLTEEEFSTIILEDITPLYIKLYNYVSLDELFNDWESDE